MKKIFTLFLSLVLFASCSSEYEILKSAETITLAPDSPTKRIGGTITFNVTHKGEVVTDEAVIYVDNTVIEGNTFTSETIGTHEVRAVYDGIESETVSISFHDDPQSLFQKRVLIEDYTGTWCGYCPRVAYGIELVNQSTDKAVPVAIHRPSSNPSSINYDPYNFDASELEAAIGLAGYPNGQLDRRTQWTDPEPDNTQQVINLLQDTPRLGLALSPVVNGNTIALDVNVKFGQDYNGLKLVVYVLENGLIYDQHNYTTYYNGEDILVDFEHNHVLRACLTSIMGDAISSAQTTEGSTFTRTFNVAMPANVANTANIEFVAFVVDGQGNAINVRKAVAGDVQEFEEL